MRERNRSPPSVALLVFVGVFFFADFFFFFLLANLGFFFLENPEKRRDKDRIQQTGGYHLFLIFVFYLVIVL